ncbi:hypothetical protein PENTCL1PPCAC_5874, partial [Pristionchus entomophagus]
ISSTYTDQDIRTEPIGLLNSPMSRSSELLCSSPSVPHLTNLVDISIQEVDGSPSPRGTIVFQRASDQRRDAAFSLLHSILSHLWTEIVAARGNDFIQQLANRLIMVFNVKYWC